MKPTQHRAGKKPAFYFAFAFVALVLAIATVVFALLEPPAAPHTVDVHRTVTGPQATPAVQSDAADATATSPAPLARASLPETPESATGTAEITVRWSDGTAASGVWTRLVQATQQVTLSGRTNSDGRHVFGNLRSASALIGTDRTPMQAVQIEQGRCVVVDVVIPAGVTLDGRVVDELDRGVAGAAVWMSVSENSSEMERVAHTDDEGAFELRDTNAKRDLLATARGMASVQPTRIGDATTIKLRMQRAPGRLVGRVTDPSRNPVKGANVLVGATMTGEDGSHRRLLGNLSKTVWAPRFTRTDPNGVFEVDGLLPARWPVYVATPRCAPYIGVVEVQDGPETLLDISLVDGATLSGRVADEYGAPLDATVKLQYEVLDTDPRVCAIPALAQAPIWACPITRCGAGGEYVLERLVQGRARVLAFTAHACATDNIDIRAAGSTWNPTLPSLACLAGRVLDASGRGIPGYTIVCNGSASAAARVRLESDQDGHFEQWVKRDLYQIVVTSPRGEVVAELPGVMPGGDEILVRLGVALGSGRISGRLIGTHDWTNGDTVIAVTETATGAMSQTRPSGDGSYVMSKLPAGHYQVVASGRPTGVLLLGQVELLLDGEVDLGTVACSDPSELAVKVMDASGGGVANVLIEVEAGGRGIVARTSTSADGIARILLHPGDYVVRPVLPKRITRRSVQVPPNGTVGTLTFTTRSIDNVVVQVNNVTGRRRIVVSVADTRGRVLLREMLATNGAHPTVSLGVDVGEYTLVVFNEGEEVATKRLTIRGTDVVSRHEIDLPDKK